MSTPKRKAFRSHKDAVTKAFADMRMEPFGVAVIQIMEDDTDWGPDTADRIQAAAAELGLATSDRQGYFKVTPRGKIPGSTPLAEFAGYVLNLLERTKEWGSDTADSIAQRAMDNGLAKLDGTTGMFKGTSKVMRRNPKTSAKDFSLGAMERHADLNITRRHGAYIVIGFAPDGSHVNEGFKTLEGARGYAKRINRGGKSSKNPRKVRVVRTNPVISLEEYQP